MLETIILWSLGLYVVLSYLLGAVVVVTEVWADPSPWRPTGWMEILCWFLAWLTSPVAVAWWGYRWWKDR